MKDMLTKVLSAMDLLIKAGERHHGLIPSITDLHEGFMLAELPPHVDGQRDHDRTLLGCNIMHDIPLLKAMYGISHSLGERRYADAADAYLTRFAVNCTNTPTGLFPWGEHAFWDLVHNRVGSSSDVARPHEDPHPPVHDHLRQAPVWFWEKMWALNPDAVRRQSAGLNWHWKEGDPGDREYIRHAYINGDQRLPRGNRSCDFARHGGFYMLDIAYVMTHDGDAEFGDAFDELLDYWWRFKEDSGRVRCESRTELDDPVHHQDLLLSQGLSLAVSLLETAELLDACDPVRADRCRQRAARYLDGFCTVPNDFDHGSFVCALHPSTGAITRTLVTWGSTYGQGTPGAGSGLLALRAYQLLGDHRLLTYGQAMGAVYASCPPLPADRHVVIRDAGLAVELLVELHAITGDAQWLDSSLALSQQLLGAYMDTPLPRVASGKGWYESQPIPGHLLHAVARAVITKEQGQIPFDGDFTNR